MAFVRISDLGVILGALCLLLAGFRPAEADTFGLIYGEDGRREWVDVRDPKLLLLADSSIALFKSDDVSIDRSSKRASLKTSPFMVAGFADFQVCKGEPYLGQGMGAFCSGVLVGEDLVLTAGHCIKSERSCRNDVKFVFGFRAGKDGRSPEFVSSEEVYSCARVVADQDLASDDWSRLDYALVKLDRKVTNHRVATLRRSGVLEVGSPVVAIGHPIGLPTKLSVGGQVRSVESDRGFFESNVDVYAASSGSPVFHAITGELEGIISAGEGDFEYDLRGENVCVKSRRLKDDEGRGERSTLISAVLKFIPENSRTRRR